MYRKSFAHPARLCYAGHVLMENRHGLVVDAAATQATGRVEDIVREMRPHLEIYVRCLEDNDALQRALVELPGVDRVRPERTGVAFDFDGDAAAQAALLARLVTDGLHPVEFAAQETDLEDVFLSLTEGKVQ